MSIGHRDVSRGGAITAVALALITTYQRFLSPRLGRHCRFFPSCSQYAQEAIAAYGVGRGGLLGLRRLGRCHPLHPGGYDPVPEARVR